MSAAEEIEAAAEDLSPEDVRDRWRLGEEEPLSIRARRGLYGH